MKLSRAILFGRTRIVMVVALGLAACSSVSAPAASPATPAASTSTSVPTTASTSATPTSATPTPGFDVAAENAKPGSPAWQMRAQAPKGHVLEGYADRTSVLPGEPFGVYVSATAASVSITAVRIGWYGGAQGRIVWRSKQFPTRVQSAPVADPVTRAYSARWPRSTSVNTTGWPEGDYLLRLAGSDTALSYVPITIRSASVVGRVVLMNEDLTWQAYNTWGGRSLYQGDGGGFGSRSYAVSFDRPYQAGGRGLFTSFEYPVVVAAEKLGIRLAYETDIDVATRPGLLAGAIGLISPGHDEYWTVAERLAVEHARDAGTNLAFLGANISYWRVRLAVSRLGANRTEVGYKGSSRDPITGATTTARFRDSPNPHPEQLMTGQRYECFPVKAAFVVRDPKFFLFAGSGAAKGQAFPGLIGVEIDRPYPIASTPRPLQVPALSPVKCNGVSTYSGFTYYTARSGAGVIAVGTMNWVRALGGATTAYGMTSAVDRFVVAVSANIFRAISTPHLGTAHPAVDELMKLHLSATNTTGVG